MLKKEGFIGNIYNRNKNLKQPNVFIVTNSDSLYYKPYEQEHNLTARKVLVVYTK